MTKADLVAAIADSADISRVRAEQALSGVVDAIRGALAAGDKVTLAGFGSFSVNRRGPRKGRNPKTGEQIDIASRASVRFNAGTTLRRTVSGDE